MTVDPIRKLVNAHHPAQATPGQGRTAETLIDHERRLKALETSKPALQLVHGVPNTSPRGATGAVDDVNNRLWAFHSGAWHYVGLT